MPAREVAADVKRQVGTQRGEPAGFLFHIACTVVLTGDDESRDFDVADLYRAGDRMLDRSEVAAETAVELRLLTLEVDVHGVDMRAKRFQGRRRDRAVCHEDDGEAGLVQQRRRVHDELIA